MWCDLDEQLNIHMPNEVSFNIIHIPWQHLKSAVFGLAARHRASTINATRTFCGEADEIDQPVLRKIVDGLGTKERNALVHISTGAFWADDQLGRIHEREGLCRHCGAVVEGPHHVLWDCPWLTDVGKTAA